MQQTNKPLSYESLKNFIVQYESETERIQTTGSTMSASIKCFNCDNQLWTPRP